MVDEVLLQQELQADEGKIPHAYADDLGFLTIGIGRLIDVRKGGRLSDDEIMYLFRNDWKSHAADLYKAFPWVAQLSDARQRALINMCFQMGVEGLGQFHHMLGAMQTGDFDAAASFALDSAWAEQTQESRVQRVVGQIKNG